MKDRESHFTEAAKVTVFCGTWNVNAKKQDGDLNEWLLPNGPTVNADIYAVGFQEMVDLNAMNVIADNSKSQQRSVFWQDKIAECLQATGVRYQPVAAKYLVGLLICVFTKESLAPHIKDVRSTSLGVGIMGMLGNKGGVSVRMWVYDTSLCFVCAHLAAHRENVAGRNSDYKNILERSVFTAEAFTYDLPDNSGSSSSSSSSSNNGNGSSSSSTLSSGSDDDLVVRPRHGAAKTAGVDLGILDHEVVFWLGDLNYRFDDLSTDEVFDACAQGSWPMLREHDQLNVERRKGAVFHGFHEGDLNFAPTYKYEPGTDEYDRRPEKKVRAPAWCDRVLWRISDPSLPADAVRQLSYRRACLSPSDHKPVSSLFSCNLRVVVAAKFNAAYRDIMAKLERWQSSKQLPVVDITGLKVPRGLLVLYDYSLRTPFVAVPHPPPCPPRPCPTIHRWKCPRSSTTCPARRPSASPTPAAPSPTGTSCRNLRTRASAAGGCP